MQLFKSLLLTLLIVGTLNSCKKDDGGGSDGTSKSKDSVVNNGYSTASINSNYHEYSYTLKRTNDNIEEFELVPDISWRISGDFHLNNDGKPFKIFLFDDERDTIQIKYVGSDISEITSSYGTKEEFESNFKLIESKNNQYVYGVEYNEPGDIYEIEEGLKINVYPDLDSVHIIRFDSTENEPLDINEEFGFKYVKSVKTSFAINCFNYSQATLEVQIWNCAEVLIVANILENLGATYFLGGSDKDYEISFDQNKLPVKILWEGYRAWTAIYQS